MSSFLLLLALGVSNISRPLSCPHRLWMVKDGWSRTVESSRVEREIILPFWDFDASNRVSPPMMEIEVLRKSLGCSHGLDVGAPAASFSSTSFVLRIMLAHT